MFQNVSKYILKLSTASELSIRNAIGD